MGGLGGYGSFLDDVTRWCSDFFFSPFMHIEHGEVKKKKSQECKGSEASASRPMGPSGRRREQTPKCCPLTSKYSHPHTPENKNVI